MIKKVKVFKERFPIAPPTLVHKVLKEKTRTEIKKETKQEFMEWVQTQEQAEV